MYGSRGAMLGSGGVSDGYEVGSKRQRMMESNPYFAVSSGASGFQPYGYGGGFQPPPFPVVRLRGLPFNCSDVEILKFFAGLDIVDVLLVNKSGRFTGEAFVVFAGPMQVEFALQRDRQNMGRRYVEVFRCKRQDYYNAVAAEVNYEGIYDNDYHGSPPPSRAKRFSDKDQMEYTEILKMRGLPFSAKKAEIIEFFKDFKLIDERIHIACRPDGKATGEAYVEFISAEEAKRAMSKDKMTIGSRVPTPVSVLISAAVFALAHLTPGEFPQLFVLGTALGFSYAQTRNLLTPITIHAFWNSGVVLILTLLQLQGYDIKELLQAT